MLDNLKILTALTFFLTSGITANALPRFAEDMGQEPSVAGIEFAQAALDSLAETDLRRLNFYTDRAITALADLANEDILAGQNGGALSGNSVEALRSAIARLVDAGKRSGLSNDDVAGFFLAAAEQRFTQQIPLGLQNASGGIDVTGLFSGFEERTLIGTKAPAEDSYLALLEAESVDFSLGLEGDTDQGNAAESALIGPIAPDGANDISIEIIGRVMVENDEWRIEIVQGDNLAAIAAAIYGDSLSYRTIYNANTNVLVNANSLTVGQVLTIPKP